MSGTIGTISHVSLMPSKLHDGGFDVANLSNIVFEGFIGSSFVTGSNQVSGTSENITFKDLIISDDFIDPTLTAISFTDSGGRHTIDNLSTSGNTASNYLEFGVNCFNGVADGTNTFGKHACTIKNSDLTGSSGIIKLNDLGSGEYAYIKLERSTLTGIEVGDGWYVLYDSDTELGTVTYTGSATSSQLVMTTNLPSSTASTPEISFKEYTVDTTITLGSTDFEAGKTVIISNTSGSASISIFLDSPGQFYSTSMTADATTVRLRNGDVLTFYVESSTVAHILAVSSQNSPKSAGGIMAGNISGQGFHSEIIPTGVGQVPFSVGFGNTVTGIQFQDITAVGYSVHFQNMSVNIGAGQFSSLYREFKLSDGNYQSFTIIVDLWQPGSGSTFSSWNFVLQGSLRADLGASGVPVFSDLITQSTKWGPLDLEDYMRFFFEFSTGYGGNSIQFKSTNLQAIPNGNLSCATRLTIHTRN